MRRIVANQPDLFAPRQRERPLPTAQTPPERPPLEELAELLALVRRADRMPWPDLPTTMLAEQRAYSLARQAGPEGARLATAIMDETERLFAAAENDARGPGLKP